MADLIDRNALLEKKTVLWDDALGWTECVDIDDIESAPAVDAVEVVRCKDCRQWDSDPDSYGKSDGPKGKCMKTFETTEYDDFCSYGERKET